MATFSIWDPVPWFREQMYVSIQLGVEGEVTAYQEGVNLKPKLSKWQALLTDGPVPNTLHFPTGTRCALKVERGTLYLNLKAGTGGPDEGIRFLPWRADNCSYLQLDPAAQFVATGPLTGCNIYVAGDLSQPWFFHANKNSDDEGGETAKRKWPLDLLAAGVGGSGPMVVRGSLERAHYSSRGYQGMVFGYKKANLWEFYFWGISTGGNYVRRMC
ncbi:hypothetical protein [Mesorhizobium sp.]|uniref:hypothetical protein n=1 Tax=Mesorhizobium sp. TaxID=1871066 RepID=UPI0025D3F87B|nr:hypothetical protein [Mesorhizobium sp.]